MTSLIKIDPLKLKEINDKLALAKSNLKMADSLLAKREFIRETTDLGYNAAELCARGLILLKQDGLPSRHCGIVQRFSELFIKDEPLERGNSGGNCDKIKDMKADIDSIKRKILPILKPYEVERVGLFGSSVKGKMIETSDIDILVDIKRDISLLEFVDLKLKLEEALGRTVDLVEYEMIKPALKERVLKEQIQIL